MTRSGATRSAATSINQQFAASLSDFKQRLISLEKRIDPQVTACEGDEFHQETLAAFEDSQQACREFEQQCGDDKSAITEAQEFFRRETDPWFSQSWIANRARTKPSGFAGDFEMLIKLYDQATPARGLGSYLDLCIMDLALARGVRSRMRAAREFLQQELASRDGVVRILDIASGPCREYLDWPRVANPIEVVAMDNDLKAVDYVQHDVIPQLPDGVTLDVMQYNALRTRSAEATIRKVGRFDIIYSVGLCDYLSDSLLVRLLRGWRDTLADDGVLYVAFKDRLEYDKTPYQWHLDWFFFQRTMQDVLRLYEQAGFDVNSMETVRDDSGVIINFISRRSAGAIRRTDEATAGMPAPNLTEKTLTSENSATLGGNG